MKLGIPVSDIFNNGCTRFPDKLKFEFNILRATKYKNNQFLFTVVDKVRFNTTCFSFFLNIKVPLKLIKVNKYF